MREPHAALVKLDWDAASMDRWQATEAEYVTLRDALVVYDDQLGSAPRAQVRDAQLATMNRLVDHAEKRRGTT